MDFVGIDEYIKKLPNNEIYTKLVTDDRVKSVFAAFEKLKDYFPKRKITNRAVALQTLYMLEGEQEEYAKLKRHGVKSYKVKDVSANFEGSGISPDVLDIMGVNKVHVGRLI